METVTLSLISHTNVGKTTLTRTLLGRDVGEVRDEAHVTMESERHTLLETPEARLVLWDTPGFGDSARLLARLRKKGSPVGWFLTQVWDRLRDRPLYSSQQALRNVSEEADVVLYLVNASEDPGEAGYVAPELEILSYVERPILVLLNQIGPAGADSEGTLEAWRRALAPWSLVRGLLPLDAFSRCWVQEGLLFERLGECLPPGRRATLESLAATWTAERRALFERTVAAMARTLVETARDREPLGSTLGSTLGGVADRPRAMKALAERQARREQALWDTVLADHRIEGQAALELRRALQDFEVQGAPPLSPRGGAVLGGLLTGALSGLAADALAGGLTLGGGMIAGGILGALGGAGLTRAYRLLKGEEEPAVAWSPAALRELAERSLVRYLAVAHYGRGRGPWREEAEPQRWRESAARLLPPELPEARQAEDDGQAEGHFHRLLDRCLRELLEELYPGALRW